MYQTDYLDYYYFICFWWFNMYMYIETVGGRNFKVFSEIDRTKVGDGNMWVFLFFVCDWECTVNICFVELMLIVSLGHMQEEQVQVQLQGMVPLLTSNDVIYASRVVIRCWNCGKRVKSSDVKVVLVNCLLFWDIR